MLDSPDVYKDIDEIARKKVQSDIENNLIPDYEHFDLQHEEKINRKKYMDVIERLIKNCPINGDYEKYKKELQDYVQKYIDDAYSPMSPATVDNLIGNYKQNEFQNALNPPLQAFILYVELIRLLYFYIQEKYIKKCKDNKIILTHNFIQYSLELLNGICSLLLGGNNNSVISMYRTFYENYIIFNFLQRHEELTDAFIEHTQITDCMIQMEYAKLNTVKISDEVTKQYTDLISKYGEDFKDNYGWTSAVISEKSKRKLKTMFEESDLGESFNYFYKISCRYSHSTAFSLMVRPEFKQLTGFLLEITDIVDKEFKVLFGKISIKSTKESALLADWPGVATDNMKRELFNWFGEKTS